MARAGDVGEEHPTWVKKVKKKQRQSGLRLWSGVIGEMAFASHQPKAGDANFETMMQIKKDADVADMVRRAQEAAAKLNVSRASTVSHNLLALHKYSLSVLMIGQILLVATGICYGTVDELIGAFLCRRCMAPTPRHPKQGLVDLLTRRSITTPYSRFARSIVPNFASHRPPPTSPFGVYQNGDLLSVMRPPYSG